MNKKRFLKRLGVHVARIRRKKGYSQDRLYLEGGFSRGTMSKIENGISSPEVYTMARVAEILGVSLSDLLDIKDT